MDSDGPEFHHPYFCPTRHMPPCNSNAKCNMSPTIAELFLFFRSMTNVQILAHASGIAKYILKYVGKFDQGSRAIASVNTQTGNIRMGTQFMHNTKIESSRINEERASQQRRDHANPAGRDYPLFEMLQLIMGYPEEIGRASDRERGSA